MSKTWVYSDPHFGHANICKFTNYDGSKLRPWDDVNEMNEDLVRWYNELVHPEDRVYILGDFAMSPRCFKEFMPRLMGRKVLVPGNHEPKGFDKFCIENRIEIRGYVQRKGFIMSHIPLHPESLGRWGFNIHGHTHDNTVRYPEDTTGWLRNDVDDPRYFCACVERTNFRPILLDDILKVKPND